MKQCPVCKAKLIHQTWYGEFGLEEYKIHCPKCQQYVDHWSYGLQYLKIGKWSYEFTSHSYVKGKVREIANRAWTIYYKRLNHYLKRNRRK